MTGNRVHIFLAHISRRGLREPGQVVLGQIKRRFAEKKKTVKVGSAGTNLDI